MKQILIMGIIAILFTSGIGVMSIQNDTFEKVETCCIEGVDNDSGLIGSENGDCWIQDGAVFFEDYDSPVTYNNFVEILPELKKAGVKTIQLLPIWEHCNSDNPSYRWAVRDYYRLDPARGNEEDLPEFISQAHAEGIKVLTTLVDASSLPPTPACGNEHWDHEGKGGFFYRYQIEHPDEYILLRDINGEFACDSMYPIGFGYAVARESPDVLDLIEDIFEKSIQPYNFDGIRLDASCRAYCHQGEMVVTSCEDEPKPCQCPVEGEHLSPYGEWRKFLKPDQIFTAELSSSSNWQFDKWLCEYPYYPPDSRNDEFVEVSEDGSFQALLGNNILTLAINSKDFVNWLKEEPVSYNRQRFRYVTIWTTSSEIEICNFIVNDHRYYPVVVLVSTIPGIPAVTDSQLFGRENESGYFPPGNNPPEERKAHWEKVLNIRNNNNALKYGTIENVWESGDNTYAYLREFEDEKVIVIVNFLDKQAISTLNLSFLDAGTILYDGLNNETFIVNDSSNFEISIPAYGSRILFLKKGDEPIICIEKPEDGYLYIFDKEIMPSIVENAIILGKITIKADAFDENGIEKVEFYIDDELKYVDKETPYEWRWDEILFGIHTLKIIAHDNNGHTACDEIDLFVFNI